MADRPSIEELVDLGLYEPDAPDATDRLEMLTYLFDRGATVEEVSDAWQTYGWQGIGTLGVELVARPGGRPLTFDEAVERSGMDPERLAALVRALGFPDPREVKRPFTEDEIDILVGMLPLEQIVGWEGVLELARVVGTSMARIAEAGSALFRLGFEVPKRSTGTTVADMAKQNAEVVGLILPTAARLYEAVAARHVIANSYRAWSVDESLAATTAELAVGFADIAGFSARVQGGDVSDVATVVRGFEQRSAEVIERGGGRLVKLIGDEVMFVADTAARGCDIACGLVEAFAADPVLPPVRVGLGFGPVVTMRGDYYGPVVNLAARLVAVADPSSAVVSESVVGSLDGERRSEPLGEVTLKGFEAPVPVHRLDLGRRTIG